MTVLDRALAGRFAAIALGHVTRAYPNLPQLALGGAEDLRAPRELHPIFYGSLDWHSCVHGYWMLARLSRLFPDMTGAGDIAALFARQVTPAHAARETAYFDAPLHRGFERSYGWAWLLKLAAELFDHPTLARFGVILAPLAERIAALYAAFLPRATYPIRAGTHANSAFGVLLALDYAERRPDCGLAAPIAERARHWFGADATCQAWEPSGDDFLSPSLTEAALMARLLTPEAFAGWFGAFLPDLAEGRPATLFAPAVVSDRGDGKIAHLDGLNLSRVWCWRRILHALPADDAIRPAIEPVLRSHLDASLGAVSGDYMGEHWLATYAVMALQTTPDW